jgi:hemerythrin-like metal-binding protein
LRLGELLVHNSVITRDELIESLHYQKKQDKKIPLGMIFIELGFVDTLVLASFLALQSELTDKYMEDIVKAEGEKSDIQPSFRELEPNIEHIVSKVQEKYKQINLKTNIQIIDIQHVWLFSLIYYIEFFYRNIFSKEKEKFLVDIISECLRYASRHFAVEEELIKILDFKVEEHSKDHKRFSIEIITKKNFIDNPVRDKTGISEKMLIETFNFLRDWSLSHIAVRDKEYVIYLDNIKNKNEIIKQWVRQLQEKNFLQITKLQKKLYDLVFEIK